MTVIVRSHIWLSEKRDRLQGRIATLRQRIEDGDRGASMVEYGILVGLIAVVAIVAIGLVGRRVNNTFQNVANTLPGG